MMISEMSVVSCDIMKIDVKDTDYGEDRLYDVMWMWYVLE